MTDMARTPGRAVQPELRRAYPRLVAAEGVEVIDDRGRRLLDAVAGVGVMTLGHTVPEIVEAMRQQAERLPFVHAMQFSADAPQELAAELSLLSPPEIPNFFFCSGGSEAMESALKIARQYHLERGEPARYRFIGRWQSFHGNTLASQAIGGHILRRRRHLPLLLEFPHIDPPNCYRDHSGGEHIDCFRRYADLLRTCIERTGPEMVAGFVMETITGATTGALVPPPGYLERIRGICDEYGILLILDEVYTAIGRSGRNYAFEHWGVLPDIVIMSKGIGGGFVPIGAVGISRQVLDAFLTGSGILEHNFTFASHPVACAGATAAHPRDRAGFGERGAAGAGRGAVHDGGVWRPPPRHRVPHGRGARPPSGDSANRLPQRRRSAERVAEAGGVSLDPEGVGQHSPGHRPGFGGL